MLKWFEETAPIRQKFSVMLGTNTALASVGLGTTLLCATDAAPHSVLIGLATAAVGATAAFGVITKKRVCGPYVNTVLRMEGLADGDLDSQIRYTHYKDCVGRMTKAMATFRDNAQIVKEAQIAQEVVTSELSKGLKNLSENDLTYTIKEAFPEAYETLRADYNNAIAAVSDAMTSVRETAASVRSGATEIRSACDDLSQRTEQQAASLEETAAAMNQVTGMVKETAESATEVSKSIGEAHSEASEGGRVVQRAVGAMDAIENSAQEITQIINVIDGIAFQTNLLALNAGVEAARAGDAGKGFAVVANEVRALAQRSAEAAKDIKALITTSADQVAEGVSLVGETGSLLEKIVNRVGEVNALITTIAETAEIQATNLQQVNSAVNDMDKMTQQNAAMVEESTAAARSLAGEADELTQLVADFRTDSNSAPVAAATPKPEAVRAAPAPLVTSGNLALQASDDDEDWSEF